MTPLGVRRYQMLMALSSINGRINQRTLARVCETWADVVSRALPPLVELGLIERKRSGRENLLRLTPEGRRIALLLRSAEASIPPPRYSFGKCFVADRAKIDPDSEIRVSKKPNSMIELFINGVISALGIRMNTRKDRHAKDALERLGSNESLDVLVVPKPLAAGLDKSYREYMDPDNNLSRTMTICELGYSSLHQVELVPEPGTRRKERTSKVYMLGGAAAEEYMARTILKKFEIERVAEPSELLDIAAEHIECGKPVSVLLKPPYNAVFSLMGRSLQEYGMTAYFRDFANSIEDCIIARKAFTEEHPEITAKIQEVAEDHARNLDADENYRLRCTLIQADLLLSIIPNRFRKRFKELDEIARTYEKCCEDLKRYLLPLSKQAP